jgi:NAD(P)-dependent dehydrogenase (short-subunit alcohol dehydrogenase family)
MADFSKVRKYWPQYKVSNIIEMIRNSSKKPKVCNEPFNGLVVITGATSGIGYYTARKYASMGARVLMINRNLEKTEKVIEEIKRDFGTEVNYLIADLRHLDEMRRVGNALSKLEEKIDVLIHNAGVYLKKKTLTSDGIETTLAVNYLAPFVITYLLKEKFAKQKSGRIIFVSSEGYRFAVWGLNLDDLNFEKSKYSGLRAYGSSKLAQVLSMMIFNDYFVEHGVTINAMHPGMVRTATGRDNGPVYLWFKHNIIDRLSSSPEVSAEALYYLGVSKDLDHVSNKFFNLTFEEELAPPAKDREEALKLWDITLKLGRLV